MTVGNLGVPVRFRANVPRRPQSSTVNGAGRRVRPTRYAAAIGVSHIVPSPYEQGLGNEPRKSVVQEVNR